MRGVYGTSKGEGKGLNKRLPDQKKDIAAARLNVHRDIPVFVLIDEDQRSFQARGDGWDGWMDGWMPLYT